MEYLTLANVSQVGIGILGVLSIFLVARKNKWGFVCGLASQPFWYITAYQNHQWGIQVLNVFYTFSWISGIYVWFFKKNKGGRNDNISEKTLP